MSTGLFGFPNPVNEKAARVVAGGVLTLSVLTLLLGTLVAPAWLWLVAVLAVGFLLRVLAGPRFSPLGRFATQVAAPRLGPARLVAGPPKRFAQGIGLAVTTIGTLALAVGVPGLTEVCLAVLIVAAGLESLAGFCLGCTIFGALIRAGLIPESTCEACSNVALVLGNRG